MNRLILILLLTLCCSSSCKKFLEETPKSFLSPAEFYKTQQQIEAAVNGCYTGLSNPWNSIFVGLGLSPMLSIEDLTGYDYRTYLLGDDESDFLNPDDPIPNTNGYLETLWKGIYYPIENCNSVIENISKTNVIDEATKNKYLGQVYFLRAWYYFLGVQLFGSIPLKTRPTSGLDSLLLPKTPVEDIYNQIVSDLTKAEQTNLPWVDKSGHVNMGAVKSLLAKVYITMAGYPLQKGNEYYQKAYEKAKEVINSGQYSLFSSYAEIRDPANDNTGENIFMLQRDPDIAANLLSYSTLPHGYPVASSNGVGGVMIPDTEFIDSYASNDKRLNGFFYSQKPNFEDPSKLVTLPQPYLLKYWDDVGAKSGKYGNNIPLIRYADVLLVCAEAKASLDGGTTSDQSAINAYYQVHNRAFPNEAKPSSITFDQIFKERCWELCYEFKTWFDMIRTHKAFDVVNNKVVDLIGYQAPSHIRPFKESDLLLPIPLTEIQLNPQLKK